MTLSNSAARIAGMGVEFFEALKEHGKQSPDEQLLLAETFAAHRKSMFPMTVACPRCITTHDETRRGE